MSIIFQLLDMPGIQVILFLLGLVLVAFVAGFLFTFIAWMYNLGDRPTRMQERTRQLELENKILDKQLKLKNQQPKSENSYQSYSDGYQQEMTQEK